MLTYSFGTYNYIIVQYSVFLFHSLINILIFNYISNYYYNTKLTEYIYITSIRLYIYIHKRIMYIYKKKCWYHLKYIIIGTLHNNHFLSQTKCKN